MASSPALATANQPSLPRAVNDLPDLLLVARCQEDLTAVTAALAALRSTELDALASLLRRGRLATVSSLAEVMVALVDPRDGRGVRHHLLTILVVTACAVLAGKDTWAGITRWAQVRGPAVRAVLVAGGWVPPLAAPSMLQVGSVTWRVAAVTGGGSTSPHRGRCRVRTPSRALCPGCLLSSSLRCWRPGPSRR